MNTINNIRKALTTLGVKGSAQLRYANADRIVITVNGEYFGIWDSEKNTFVD